jgi:hypothetical protein
MSPLDVDSQVAPEDRIRLIGIHRRRIATAPSEE